MQTGYANHELKMSGIPTIRTGSETEDKTNSVAGLITRDARAEMKSTNFAMSMLRSPLRWVCGRWMQESIL
jgi:hypothetical protein